MKKSVLATIGATALFALTGCADRTVYYAPPPPPPPLYGPSPALLDLASRNGFQSGTADGARDRYYGYRYAPRRTAAYRDAPGYDRALGPAEPYVNVFRNAYLRGYDGGYYHR